MSRQDGKVFIGGLSWETTDENLRRYFENYGTVQEAFVSYDRHTGRPRGFGFVVFADPVIADKVVAQQHTIDRREVEAKKALPKDESPVSKDLQAAASGQRTKKIFVGGLAASVDEAAFRGYFEDFGTVEDAVVMYDHDNRRPRGFGFITFSEEEAVDKVFGRGTIQTIHEKQIEIKRAVPRDSMPPSPRAVYRPPHHYYESRSPYQQQSGRYSAPRGERERSYPPPGYSGGGRGPRSDGGGHRSPMAGGSDRGMYTPGPAVVTGIPATMATTPGAEGAIPAATAGVITPPPGMANAGGMMGVGQPQSPLPMSQGMQPTSPLVGSFALQNGMQGAATTPGGQFSPTYARDAQQAQQAARNLADLQQQVTLTSVSALEQLQVQQVQAQQAQQAPSTIWS